MNEEREKGKQISVIYLDNKSPGCSFLIVLRGVFHNLLRTFQSQHLSPNHPRFFVTSFFFIYLPWTKLYPHMVSCSYSKSKSTKWPRHTQKPKLCSAQFYRLFFLCFPTTISFFPEGQADMNATLTANPMRRTFQSPIITKNQTSKVPWPGCFVPFQ